MISFSFVIVCFKLNFLNLFQFVDLMKIVYFGFVLAKIRLCLMDYDFIDIKPNKIQNKTKNGKITKYGLTFLVRSVKTFYFKFKFTI